MLWAPPSFGGVPFPAVNGNGAAVGGYLPISGVTPDPAGSGALFGSTSRGGNYKVNGYGGGVVFKLTPPAAGKTAWTETVLHAFTGLSDGIFPGGGNVLVQGGNGIRHHGRQRRGPCLRQERQPELRHGVRADPAGRGEDRVDLRQRSTCSRASRTAIIRRVA